MRARKRRVVLEYAPLELAQLRPRVQAQLVGEPVARRLKDGQGVGLPRRLVEGEHQRSEQAFAKRIVGHEPLQLGHKLEAATQLEIRVDPLLQCVKPPLLQLSCIGAGKRLEQNVGQGGAAPDRERCTQIVCRSRRVPRAGSATGACHEGLESVDIELARLHPERVTGGLATQPVAAEHLP